MMSSSPVVPFMKAPVPFITDTSGAWDVQPEAIEILNCITVPISVTAIVGKYRTGKSYLMNRLAGNNAGFAVGSKVQAQTKGIWMWATPHQKDPNRCLILLDTEGLHDVEICDKSRDIAIFTFAVLLSKCLVFNVRGTLDSTVIEELALVAKLAGNVRVSKLQNDAMGETNKAYFPSLFLVLRDFHLDLTVNDKVTSDQYLERSLKEKRGYAEKDIAFNCPRIEIKKFFTRRKCFCLPKPVTNDDNLGDLGKPGVEVTSKFLEKSEEAIQAILNEAEPLTMDGNGINGSGFVCLVREYARCVNEGAVPCIESAIDVMKTNQRKKAFDDALEIYQKGMGSRTADKLPMDTSELGMLHSEAQCSAVQRFKELLGHQTSDNDTCCEKLKKDIDRQFQKKILENSDESKRKSKDKIKICFRQLEKDISEEKFHIKGGSSQYTEAKNEAVFEYNIGVNLGPMKDGVLKEYLEKKQDAEQGIRTSDNLCTKRDREKELMEQNYKEEQKKLRLEHEKKVKEDEMQLHKRQQKLDQMARNKKRKFETMLQAQSETVARQQKELSRLLLKLGREKQSTLYKLQFDDADQNRERKEREKEQQEWEEGKSKVRAENIEKLYELKQETEQYEKEFLLEMRKCVSDASECSVVDAIMDWKATMEKQMQSEKIFLEQMTSNNIATLDKIMEEKENDRMKQHASEEDERKIRNQLMKEFQGVRLPSVPDEQRVHMQKDGASEATDMFEKNAALKFYKKKRVEAMGENQNNTVKPSDKSREKQTPDDKELIAEVEQKGDGEGDRCDEDQCTLQEGQPEEDESNDEQRDNDNDEEMCWHRLDGLNKLGKGYAEERRNLQHAVSELEERHTEERRDLEENIDELEQRKSGETRHDGVYGGRVYALLDSLNEVDNRHATERRDLLKQLNELENKHSQEKRSSQGNLNDQFEGECHVM